MVKQGQKHFLCREETGGPFLLLVMAVLGLVLANSPLRPVYALLDVPVNHLAFMSFLPAGMRQAEWPSIAEIVTIGPMALFFLTITLELKKELVSGHLASWRQCLLPCLSALGGVLAPACLYGVIAGGGPALRPGWAIPVATDAAFTLPILLALGRYVSEGGRVWLMALAIFDDVLGILIIAFFYGGTIHLMPLLAVVGVTGLMALACKAGLGWLWLYGAGGCLLWLAMWQAGLHPTLVGVIIGLCLPLGGQQKPPGGAGCADENEPAFQCRRDDAGQNSGDYAGEASKEGMSSAEAPSQLQAQPAEQAAAASLSQPVTSSPLERMEHRVGPWVTWLVLPVFGFVTTGVPLLGVPASLFSLRLILAVSAGLVLGKLVGIFTMTALAIGCRLARLPEGATWPMLFGLCLLCGLGFTVSLFMASLAFPASSLLISAKAGILTGSLIAALSGWLWLRFIR